MADKPEDIRSEFAGYPSSSLLADVPLNGMSVCEKLFRRKPIGMIRKERRQTMQTAMSDVHAEERVDRGAGDQGLQRVLGVWDLIAIGVGMTVGSGIFVVAGTAGKENAGPALFLSFLIGGFSCLLCGLCYAEFASRIPVAGSAYTYAYASLGEIVGFLIGWDLTLEYGIAAGTIAKGWAGYFRHFVVQLGANEEKIPEWIFGQDVNDWISWNFAAALLCFVLTILVVRGISASAGISKIMTTWNISLIIFFVLSGIFFMDTDILTHPCSHTEFGKSCEPDQENSFFPNGFQGVFAGAGVVFFSYVGFDSVSGLAEEVKEPIGRNVVIGLMGTLAIASSLYVGVSVVLLGMIPFQALDSDAPLASAFSQHHDTFLSTVVAFGAVTTTTLTTLVSLLGQPRIYYRMAVDGLLYHCCGQVHPIFRTPFNATLFCGGLSCVIGLVLNFKLLTEMISVGTLMAYIMVCGGILVLRYPSKQGPFRGGRLPSLVMFFFCMCVLFGFSVEYATESTFWMPITMGMIVVLCFCVFVYIHFTIDQPHIPDTVFRTPWVPLVPLLGILINTYMMTSLKYESFLRVVAWMILGVGIYLTYGYSHSRLNNPHRMMLSAEDEDDDGYGNYGKVPTPKLRIGSVDEVSNSEGDTYGGRTGEKSFPS